MEKLKKISYICSMYIASRTRTKSYGLSCSNEKKLKIKDLQTKNIKIKKTNYRQLQKMNINN